MRTLSLHTADELLTRWKRKAALLDTRFEDPNAHERQIDMDRAAAQAYRVCAAELAAIVAVSMELEAAHHGDPEPEREHASKPGYGVLCWCGEVHETVGEVHETEPNDEPGLLIRCDEETAANALMDWSQGRRP